MGCVPPAWWLYPSMQCASGCLPRGCWPRGAVWPGGVCPGKEVSAWGGVCPGGSAWGVSVQGGVCLWSGGVCIPACNVGGNNILKSNKHSFTCPSQETYHRLYDPHLAQSSLHHMLCRRHGFRLKSWSCFRCTWYMRISFWNIQHCRLQGKRAVKY